MDSLSLILLIPIWQLSLPETTCNGKPEGVVSLRNEELHNLYSSTNTPIIRVIKSRSFRWAVHVVRMGEVRNMYKILVGRTRMGG